MAGAIVATVLVVKIHLSVRRALSEVADAGWPVRLVPVAPLPAGVVHVGSREVEAVAVVAGELFTGGGAGVWRSGRGSTAGTYVRGLPSLAVRAMAGWRGRVVVALRSGGLFRLGDGGWEEIVAPTGRLEVRALLPDEAGDLLVGAREGLFRLTGSRLVKLLDNPVRALATGPGFVLAGGEEGLYRYEAGRVVAESVGDPWVESVTYASGTVLAVTATGIFRDTGGSGYARVAGGAGVSCGVAHEGRLVAAMEPAVDAIAIVEPDGRTREESVPGRVRRVLTTAGLLFVDTDRGLLSRGEQGWKEIRPVARGELPGGCGHVTALARYGGSVAAGIFDGPLVIGAAADPGEPVPTSWRAVGGAWGVNALLPSVGSLYVASLRGVGRYDGRKLEPLEGPGAAFALAPLESGIAVGYAEGLLLPGARLLSAWHGLPGNQVLAIAGQRTVVVGTPTGLAAVEAGRVIWATGSGDGELPHPWVTSLLVDGRGFYAGTYGGGVVRTERPLLRDDPLRELPETAGLKVSPGGLVRHRGAIYLATDGAGLWSMADGAGRFERVSWPLPSARVTALLSTPDALYVGTDEGLAVVAHAEPASPTRVTALAPSARVRS